jgi:type VI secretion system secreted protein VgrG
MARTQQFRQFAVDSPLGEDVLLLRGLVGGEELGRPFEYKLDLVSEDSDIRFEDIVGRNITVRAQRSPNDEPRYFNGYVSTFELVEPIEDMTRYAATVVPWLWFLTRSSDCRIFQDMTVVEIITKVFRDHGFVDFEDRLSGEYRQWEYCVQYRETDFNFVSRLMEQEGIYYYFRHEADRHVLVLSDSISAHDEVEGYEEVQYRPQTESLREREYIRKWRCRRRVQSGIYSHKDFDFKVPRKALLTSARIERPGAATEYELYDYRGEFVKVAEGEDYARRRIEEVQTDYEVASADSDVRGIATGCRFSLVEHPREDQCRSYLVIATDIRARSDLFESGEGGEADEENYTCSFSAISSEQTFRSARTTPGPHIRGPQTAMVVGPEGEEIYTDQYGRVKVLFHWDRYGKGDENSSCWIRVAQVWAGRKWGAMFIPRIGHEVIVDFLEGDPDQPIITGRVYNGLALPPYDPPAHATISTMKSLSSKGGEGFNEVRFEDRKGSEQIFIHAEKNQDIRVKSDCFEWIGHDRHLIAKNDQFEHVENNRHEKVDVDHLEEVGRDHHEKVSGKEAKHVGGSRSLTVAGDVIEVFQSNRSEEVAQNLYVRARGIVIEAQTAITLKVGGSNVVIDSSGVTVAGTTVTIDSNTTNINCGPGSPATVGQAGNAVSPAAPTEALPAATAEPGELTEVETEPLQPHRPPLTDEDRERRSSWIEIDLVDEENNPVAGERYRIVLPDGETVAEGTLDENGFARVNWIEPGTCRVCFPELDRDAWERA